MSKKYRIAYVMHKGDVYGGFPQHVEFSLYGLKQLGHDVDFYFIANTTQDGVAAYKRLLAKFHAGELRDRGQTLTELDIGIGTGYYYSPGRAWICPVTAVGDLARKRAFRDKLETYDAVFWHTPFWFKQQPWQMDTDWPMLLDLKHPVNIAFHHDGNLRANSAWMLRIDRYFDRLITVHPASYNACAVFRTPRCMIFNPQFVDHDETYSAYRNLRRPLLFSLQYWKSSKHVDDLLRAIPHFTRNIRVVIGGHGIEYSYMDSQDKMKPQYMVNYDKDPDADEANLGKPILQLAWDCGLQTPRWITSEQRDAYLSRAAFFVDTAWYRVSETLGAHFPRTLIEAMIKGVVPIGRNLGLGHNEAGEGDVFNPGVNYLMIPYDATPKQFAGLVEEFCNIDETRYNTIVANNYALLQHFDVMNVARQYIDVIEGRPTGFYNKWKTGHPRRAILERANKQWYGTGEKRTFNFERK